MPCAGSSGRPGIRSTTWPSRRRCSARWSANLEASGCADGARIIVEKPFGHDLASAMALNETIHGVFAEPAVFRIDHYLGKEPVQNLLYFRFANSFLEPIWNRDHVASVQINMPEALDVADRGAFYDQAGAIRDVVQNHLLQVVSLLAMEPPSGRTPEAIRNEQFKVLDSIRPLAPGDVVRGQYRGYRDVKGVAPDSTVETFAALRLHVDTWRWGGVPFYIRTGQVPAGDRDRGPRRDEAAAAVGLRRAAAAGRRLLPLPADARHVDLARRARQEAGRGDGRRGRSSCSPRHQSGTERPPYQRLIGDAIRGDQSLFAREDCGRGGLAGRRRRARRRDAAARLRARDVGPAGSRERAPARRSLARAGRDAASRGGCDRRASARRGAR